MEDVYTASLLTILLKDFHKRLLDISNIDGVNQELIKIFRNDLETLSKTIPNGVIRAHEKIQTQLKMLDQIKFLPEMRPKLEIIREQAIVLMVGALEVFITDMFKAIANNDASFFVWPEKEKKITIDIETFRSNFTLGDVFITHLSNRQYSFQDLGSIIKAVKDYLGVEYEVDQKTKDSIIIATSYRHIIVHNGSIVDKQFLNQTRNVKLPPDYKEGSNISIGDGDIENIYKALISFSKTLISKIIQRDQLI